MKNIITHMKRFIVNNKTAVLISGALLLCLAAGGTAYYILDETIPHKATTKHTDSASQRTDKAAQLEKAGQLQKAGEAALINQDFENAAIKYKEARKIYQENDEAQKVLEMDDYINYSENTEMTPETQPVNTAP